MNLLSHGRFFEYEVSWVEVPYLEFDSASNTSYGINVTELVVLPTELRQNVGYIQVIERPSLRCVQCPRVDGAFDAPLRCTKDRLFK